MQDVPLYDKITPTADKYLSDETPPVFNVQDVSLFNNGQRCPVTCKICRWLTKIRPRRTNGRREPSAPQGSEPRGTPDKLALLFQPQPEGVRPQQVHPKQLGAINFPVYVNFCPLRYIYYKTDFNNNRYKNYSKDEKNVP